MVLLLVIVLLQREKEEIEEIGVKQAMKRGLIILSSLLLLSSCISNSVSVKPDKTEYFQLVDTPVYIKRAADTDLETYEIELDQCLIASATKTTRSSKIGMGVGSVWLVSGLYAVATASGIFAPIAIAAGTVGTIAGGSTIIVTQATEEYREYAGLEDCLERLGHDVVFYDARKVAE